MHWPLYSSIAVYFFGYACSVRLVFSPVRIRFGDTEKALDASQENLTLVPYMGLPAQQWLLVSQDYGLVSIQNVMNGKTIDLVGGRCEKNNALVLYEYNGQVNQKFYLNGDKTISPYYCYNDFKLGLRNGSTSNLVLIPRNSTAVSTFRISFINE